MSLLALVGSCGASGANGASSPAPHARLGGAAASGHAIPAASPAGHAKNAPASPASLVTPRRGEPSPEQLAAVQLQPASCADVEQVVAAKVARMREQLDWAHEAWKEQQEACWRDEQAGRQRRYGIGLSDTVVAGSGQGGGSVQGFGSARGFGSGHGRLGGSHAVRAPTVRMGAVASAKRASSTNNQVAGVDEADIVKHDGRYVYLAVNRALRIVEAMNPRLLSVTPLKGEARMLFVKEDRAVVFVADGAPEPTQRPRCTYAYDCQFAGDGTRTRVVVYDVSNRARPRPLRTLKLSGSLLAARRIANAVHAVVSDGDPTSSGEAYPTYPPGLGSCDGTPFKTAWQRFHALKVENERRIRERARTPTLEDRGETVELCASALRTALQDGQAFTSLVSFDLSADEPARTVTIASRPGAVYASAEALYLAVPHAKRTAPRGWYSFYAGEDELSDVHKVAIGADPAATRYVGSGAVPGRVLNQFSMDEWSGHLRIATTRGRAPSPTAESTVSVLTTDPSGRLVRVGAVEHIAPSEDIRSVRFDAERGYVVTFKKTDPLFVLDLEDARRPRILGELKIPGFSTYIHRIDQNHLLSIGLDTDDRGSFAYFDGVLLQLFDVSDPVRPRLLHKEVIGTRGSSSAAVTDHLAFNYFPDRGLLGVPMTVCAGGDDGRFGQQLTFSGLLVYDVSVERGFTRRGGVNHGRRGATCGRWWSQADSAVKRSLFLDDLVYSVALDRVKVQNLQQLGKDIAEISMR